MPIASLSHRLSSQRDLVGSRRSGHSSKEPSRVILFTVELPAAENPHETRDLDQGDVLRVLTCPAGSGSRAGKMHSDFVN